MAGVGSSQEFWVGRPYHTMPCFRLGHRLEALKLRAPRAWFNWAGRAFLSSRRTCYLAFADLRCS